MLAELLVSKRTVVEREKHEAKTLEAIASLVLMSAMLLLTQDLFDVDVHTT